MIYIFLMASLVILGYLSIKHSAKKLEKKIREGLPPDLKRLLTKHIGIYHTLTPKLKKRFEQRVYRFLLTKPIVGYQTDIDDKLKLMVAASAVFLTLSFEKWNFSYLTSVLITDKPLNDSKKDGSTVLGQVTTTDHQSKMILSKKSLLHGFENLNDKKNVAVHEFAHVLDHADGDIDGVPKAIMPPELIDDWVALMGEKIREICDSHSDINSYGATNKAEFFAVASEYFFEKPNIMQSKHPKLYGLLSKIYNQDPSDSFKVNFKELMGRAKEQIGRNAKCPCGSGRKFKKCCMRI